MAALPPFRLPRGTPETTAKATPPAARWATPDELAGPSWAWQPGRLFLGRAGGKLIGIDDDRHVLTVAGSRSGKSKSCLIPNLYLWPGSAVVIDPKGELAEHTAARRAASGQAVYVLDPFGEVTGSAAQFRASFNPLDALKRDDKSDVPDDAALVAEALIIASRSGDSHWTDSARNLIRGLILWLQTLDSGANLNRLRAVLRTPLEAPIIDPDFPPLTLSTIFALMKDLPAFDGIVAGVGAGMGSKAGDELKSIISTAVEQTGFLDGRISDCLGHSDFSLADLKRRPMTIYLVLPASRMATHARWFRLLVTMTMAALERDKTVPAHPVLMVLEEFPQLGHLRQIEAAAGLMAGYGVKLWTVLQDLTQIKSLYRDSWETFIGNAGCVNIFGNSDSTTLDYFSRRLDSLTIKQTTTENVTSGSYARGDLGDRQQISQSPLLAPFEIATIFGRSSGRQLILIPDRPPAAIERVWLDDKELTNKDCRHG